MPGLVEQFELRAQTKKQLVSALSILLVWNSKVTHFNTGVDINGRKFITFQWHESGKGTMFPAPMTDPEMIADQVITWLANTEYGPQPDTDGHNSKGWHLSLHSPKITNGGWPSYHPYDVFTIYPHWITYDK